MSVAKKYAKLLRKADLGDALYYPSVDVKVGDVAYFRGSTYHLVMNVLEISPETAALADAMGIQLPGFGDVSTPVPYQCQTFTSTVVTVTDMQGKIATELPAASEFQLLVKKSKSDSCVAVCIPSKPLDVIAIRGQFQDWQLENWWAESRHNIAAYLGPTLSREVGAIFLVLERTVTDQVTNCFYSGKESSTLLRIVGKMANLPHVSIDSGFSCNEIGCFGFTNKTPLLNGRKWTIFIRDSKLTAFAFTKWKHIPVWVWHKLSQNKKPNKHPKWRTFGKEKTGRSADRPASRNTPQTQRPGYQDMSLESYEISNNFMLIRTPDDEYYGEFYGYDLPDELEDTEDCEEFAAAFLMSMYLNVNPNDQLKKSINLSGMQGEVEKMALKEFSRSFFTSFADEADVEEFGFIGNIESNFVALTINVVERMLLEAARHGEEYGLAFLPLWTKCERMNLARRIEPLLSSLVVDIVKKTARLSIEPEKYNKEATAFKNEKQGSNFIYPRLSGVEVRG